jgi:agmatinase
MAKLNNTLFFVQGNPKFEDADACVLGVAFDGNASFGKGAAAAPDAIMKASHQLDIEDPLTGETLQTAIHNFGTLKPKNAREMIGETEKLAKKALEKGKFLVLLGGDHSVVNGLLEAVPNDTTFVNFDAHLDLREQWQGKKMSHAAVSRRIFDKGFEQVWVGVRDRINEEEMDFVWEQGLADKIFYCPSMPSSYYKTKKFPKWMKRKNMLFSGLGSKKVRQIISEIETDKVFLNIDVDCLDMRQGLETGVPSPFGLTLEELRQAIFEICRKKKVIGLSIAELVPDSYNRGQSFAAMLCLNMLGWVKI